MNQEKIGKFIAVCRKQQNMTQMQLAEKLGITDRAVSKWETGRAMPDSSIMLALCKELKISVNDLLCGEAVTMNGYNEKLEKNLLEMMKEKELADKRLLSLEIVVGTFSGVIMAMLIFVAAFVQMPDWLRVLLIVSGMLMFVVGLFYAVKIEQVAGYYECAKCHHKYVPAFGSVLFAMHINRTRYMKCPVCGKRSWQKKVIGK